MLISLMLLAASTPGHATSDDVLVAHSVRYELVYELAKRECPLIERNNYPRTIQTIFTLTNQILRGRTYLTGGETLMLIEDCEIYAMGVNAR